MIGIIGDVLLDKYDYCSNRENPESSAPCYVVDRTEYKPGGAGNVAANVSSLGSKSILVSVIGNDDNARILENILQGMNTHLIRDSKRPTIVKERVMSVQDGRYHFRKDIERKAYIEQNHVSEILSAVKDCDIIIVSDYGKGVISKKLIEGLAGKVILVDPKPVHTEFYTGAYIITPNVKEVREMAGIANELEAAKTLQSRLNCNVLLTRSEKGVTYFGAEEFSFPTEAKKVFDVTGAGDTVIAALAHFMSKGLDVKDAVRLANKAAGIAVGYPGCYQVKESEIFEN